jgi:hypothetical protein
VQILGVAINAPNQIAVGGLAEFAGNRRVVSALAAANFDEECATETVRLKMRQP